MDYAYKPTTHGRAAMAACFALEKPLKITRVAFGSGKVDEDAELADVHELLAYVSDGVVSGRRHEDDRFFFTVQFANSMHPDIKTFFLSEFMVFAENPETGGETDLIYGTLGDYRQPVPTYNPMYPPSVFNFPLTLVLSSEMEVAVAAPSGLVTYRELLEVIDTLGIRTLPVTIPSSGWQAISGGGPYAYRRDVSVPLATGEMVPSLAILPEHLSIASACGFCPVCQALGGVLRVWSRNVPRASLSAVLTLSGDAESYCTPGNIASYFTLPPTSETVLGGVKIAPGAGLNVTADGTLSVDTASGEEINQMLAEVLTPDNK